MINTATAAVKASAASYPSSSHTARVPSASAMTTGTKTPEIRSAKRCTCALPFCACSTSLAICASCVSLPILVARTVIRPPAFTVAPTTASPSFTSTGTDSPVNIDASTADEPLSTTPSVAIRSPGRTTNRSPTARSPMGTSDSVSPLSTVTSLAPRPRSVRKAAPARRLDRISKNRPAKMKVVTPAAASR